MKKRFLLYSLAIIFTIIVINFVFAGKVEATTYSKDTYKAVFPDTYTVTQDTKEAFITQSQNGRNAVMIESNALSSKGSINSSNFLNVIKNTVNQIYPNATITSSKITEKEASVCADVLFNQNINGDSYYYELYGLESDNNFFVVTFISFDKSFLTSSEKNNIWNSFKIKDTVTVSYGLPFTDVPSKTWYRSAVSYVYTNNIINGLNSYTYGPNEKLSRAMMATILYNMAGSPKVSGTSPFKDVKDSKKWYYKAVLWASKNNIVSGYKDGNFGPNDNITREQVAVMLYKYAKYKGKNVSKLGNITTFSDYKNVASYATTQMKWAVGAGVITGSNNKLNPKGNTTRAEAASMIYKYCSKVGK